MACRAVTSRFASFAVTSEMVSWFSTTVRGQLSGGRRQLERFKLFHDLRHDEQSAGFGRRVAKGFLVREGRPRFVSPRNVDHWHRMRRRLNVTDIKFLELFDVAEDVVELRAEFSL